MFLTLKVGLATSIRKIPHRYAHWEAYVDPPSLCLFFLDDFRVCGVDKIDSPKYGTEVSQTRGCLDKEISKKGIEKWLASVTHASTITRDGLESLLGIFIS